MKLIITDFNNELNGRYFDLNQDNSYRFFFINGYDFEHYLTENSGISFFDHEALRKLSEVDIGGDELIDRVYSLR